MSRFAFLLGVIAIVVAFAWGGGNGHNPFPPVLASIGVLLIVVGAGAQLFAVLRRRVRSQ